MKGDKIPNLFELSSMMLGAVAKFKQEKVGSETVNGYKTEKFRMTATIDLMGQAHTETSSIWMAKEFDIPVRMQDEEKVAELRNIKKGEPEASLFEIPAGYEDMSKQLEEMMKMMKSQ